MIILLSIILVDVYQKKCVEKFKKKLVNIFLDVWRFDKWSRTFIWLFYPKNRNVLQAEDPLLDFTMKGLVAT